MKSIYAVYADDESLPRYVGQSSRPHERLTGHCTTARFTAKLYRIKLPDITLRLDVLEEVEDSEAKKHEKYWIKKFRELGADLANTQLGEGKYKYKPTWETMERRRQTLEARRNDKRRGHARVVDDEEIATIRAGYIGIEQYSLWENDVDENTN